MKPTFGGMASLQAALATWPLVHCQGLDCAASLRFRGKGRGTCGFFDLATDDGADEACISACEKDHQVEKGMELFAEGSPTDEQSEAL